VPALLSALFLAATGSPAAACSAPLPHGPAVPAPVVFKTDCGGFRLDRQGVVSRLPRGWLATHSGGTHNRDGAHLQVRRNRAGALSLLRRDRLVWRARDLYPNTAGDIAFGPGAFAFSSDYRGVFLTDLKGPERLVVPGRGLFPHAFFPSGRLIVTGGPSIAVLSPRGRVEHRYSYDRSAGYAFDGDTNTLFFVTPRRHLATLHEARLRVGRRLDFDGMITISEPGVLLFFGARSLTLAARDGRVIARAAWPRTRIDLLDSGASVSPDARHVAFRLSDARPGARKGNAVLFVLSAGHMHAQPVFRHRLGPVGCGIGASMGWHGRYLLYRSGEGKVAIVDADSGRRRELSRLVRALPRLETAQQPLVAWAADYG
jgi:hypothetical protein